MLDLGRYNIKSVGHRIDILAMDFLCYVVSKYIQH